MADLPAGKPGQEAFNLGKEGLELFVFYLVPAFNLTDYQLGIQEDMNKRTAGFKGSFNGRQ